MIGAPEQIEITAATGSLRTDRGRDRARFDDCVGNCHQAEEMIIAADGLVALEHVLVVWIEQRMLETERFHDAPAIWHR